MTNPSFGCEPISINRGRQLFVDDFLVADTTLHRAFHRPRRHEGNPIFKAESPLECPLGLNPSATPKGGGIWRDGKDGLFKMWYEAGWLHSMAFAVSHDGIHWERPDWGVVSGSNRILPQLCPDSNTVWVDDTPGQEEARFKLFFREPDKTPATPDVIYSPYALLMTSADGIRWSDPVRAGICGDRSTCYFDPFRGKWVFSLRATGRQGRYRKYWETAEFMEARWQEEDPVDWINADSSDNAGDCPPQLYNLDAVAYESLMLGLFEIHKGPTNEVCERSGIPKRTDLYVGFSRDGFHWHRPDRVPFIASDPADGSWERGYIQSVGGVCLVGREEIWFYYTAFGGDSSKRGLDWKHNGMYAHGATGLAKMRRDGFASMKPVGTEGQLTTHPVIFEGHTLWVNVDASHGRLTVECLDVDGTSLDGWTESQCVPVSRDSTCTAVHWNSGLDLSPLQGRPVRFRFHLIHAALYSFWVTSDPEGKSNGYLGAGSPDICHTSK